MTQVSDVLLEPQIK